MIINGIVKYKLNYFNLNLKRNFTIRTCIINYGIENSDLIETSAFNIAVHKRKNFNIKYAIENKNKNLEEASRIFNTNLFTEIKFLIPNKIDLLIIPGGKIFDKLLNNNNENFQELNNLLKLCHSLKKFVITSSNSNLIIANILGKKNLGKGVTITLGYNNKNWNNNKYLEYIESKGNCHVNKNEDEFYYDIDNNIISVPGLLHKKSNFSKVLESFDKSLGKVNEMMKNKTN